MADITLDQIVNVVVETGEVTLKPGTQELIDKAVYSLIKDSPVRHLAPELKVNPKVTINKERIREQLDQAIREIDKKISELHGIGSSATRTSVAQLAGIKELLQDARLATTAVDTLGEHTRTAVDAWKELHRGEGRNILELSLTTQKNIDAINRELREASVLVNRLSANSAKFRPVQIFSENSRYQGTVKTAPVPVPTREEQQLITRANPNASSSEFTALQETMAKFYDLVLHKTPTKTKQRLDAAEKVVSEGFIGLALTSDAELEHAVASLTDSANKGIVDYILRIKGIYSQASRRCNRYR